MGFFLEHKLVKNIGKNSSHIIRYTKSSELQNCALLKVIYCAWPYSSDYLFKFGLHGMIKKITEQILRGESDIF